MMVTQAAPIEAPTPSAPAAAPATPRADAPRLRRWTRAEYYRMAEAGILGEDDRVELLEGEIVEMSPIGSPHAAGVELASAALSFAPQYGYYVRHQQPLSLGVTSDPQPDLAVVKGGPRDYVSGHPTSAMLVVEVADPSLPEDRRRKAGLYAACDIPDYWVTDVNGRQLEVYREPVKDPTAPGGGRYQRLETFKPGDSITPLFAPDHSIAVDDLLP
ncbi:MAG: Uma2 family endonuclease [Chloroflexota bacterium]